MTYTQQFPVPAGVQATVHDSILTVKGAKGEVVRNFKDPRISISLKDNTILFTATQKKVTRREEKQTFTFLAHVKNMLQGVQHPYVYKLKICSGHFPMNVSISGKQFAVKNFLGEKVPRTITIKENVKVEIQGDQITVTSCDIERAGQTAAHIEQLTRITNRDLRIFQDGLYITEKCGEPI
jgi:large subunit ribosomal protein L6